MRKKLTVSFAALAVLAILCCYGCDRDTVAMETNALMARFEALLNLGKLTPEQKDAFIHAAAKEAFEMDRAIRGTKKATNTRNAAIAKAVEEFGIGATGVTSNANITIPSTKSITGIKAEAVLAP